MRRALVLLVGGGKLDKVAFCVAKFSPSRLPNGTSYSGPPDCKIRKKGKKMKLTA